MATATASASGAKKVTEQIFEWEGRDKNGKIVRGEMRAGGEAVSVSLTDKRAIARAVLDIVCEIRAGQGSSVTDTAV